MWRGISLRKLAVLVVAPMLSETLATLFVSWMVLRAIQMSYEPWQHMLIPIAGSVCYSASAYIAGRWVTPRVAPWLMLWAILGVTVTGLSAMWTGSYLAFVGASMVIGVLFGHYYTPFQINMTHVRPFHTLAWSVGFYNVAWGIGAAVGPFFGSWLEGQPLLKLVVLAVGVAAAHTVLNLLAWSAPPTLQHEIGPTTVFHSTPRHRWMGLAAFVVVGLAIRGLYITLWPDLGKKHYQWTPQQIGLGQFCMFIPVAVGALLWARMRRWLDKPWVMLASMGVGTAGLATVYFAHGHYVWSLVGVTAVGVMESCVVFHAIYYMNADPEPQSRGRSVGVFEMVAGVAGIAGPLVMGLLAWDDSTSWRPYLISGSLLVSAMGYVFLSGLRSAKQLAHPR